MSVGHALIWFVITAIGVVTLLVVGMYEGTHSYDVKAAKLRRHRLRHH
jgi:hypothetical protein